jgi:hypothetical protein
MIRARVYLSAPDLEGNQYLGEHELLAVPRPGEHMSIWRKLELTPLVVERVSHAAAAVDPADDAFDPPSPPSITITTTAHVPPGD